ncbi:hypothetical protein CGLO_06457 [Colletotrichum gloeosporioides Cg-14]|uniref:Heterokaryon incompatibility domain-containing protein n=1 Tax=Colletotrichum gloeosporioides (strain Cg-14) TaxID=1237896 RepID=T0KM70_COLGC|nr:hypothetical protein CGLO_06457 [Colletotrichum gloeosporioides Cg-14]
MPSRYACLSYVWGKGSQTQYTTSTRDRLEAPQGLQKADLPQTITDAIRVTKEAGLRYLWVDALCILRDEPEDKAKIISKMGLIYGGSTMTIVATTNVDPHDGLAGMGTAHRPVAQNTAKIQGMTLAVGLHDPRRPISDIESSVWDSRAWTFQERALSKRSVHFTRSQMVFKCVHGAVMLEENVPTLDPAFQHSTIEDGVHPDLLVLVWCHTSLRRFKNKGFTLREADQVMMMSEDIDLDKMDPEERAKIAPVFNITVDDAPPDFMNTLGNTKGSTPWDLYRRAVYDYTKRKLSWESDAVVAFSGVEHIIRRGTNTKFWYGLPSFAFEQALLWQVGEPLQPRYKNDKIIFHSQLVVGCMAGSRVLSQQRVEEFSGLGFRVRYTLMNIEDRFFQLGTNDESRSANYRAPWQRVVYHQGYRAGYLSLNTSSLPAEDDGCEIHMAAISRGSLSFVPPPPPGWSAYWSTGSCDVQDFLFEDQ